MTELVYRRLSASPPPIREQLELAGSGALVIWRSNGGAVGRFAGDAGAAARLAALAATAAGAEAPHGGDLPLHGVYELIELGSTTMSAPFDAAVDGDWGRLRDACRAAIDEPGEPVAAVALVMEPAGGLRLEHRGRERIRVGLGLLAAELSAFAPDGSSHTASTRSRDGVADAGPGWQLPIVLEPPDVAGSRLVASVAFNLDDGGVWIPVRCQVVSGA